MRDERRSLMQQLPKGPVSPALRQFREMVAEASPDAVPTRVTQPAQEVLSIWAERQSNLALQGRRVVGLAQLVRSLRKLSPGELVEQVAIFDGMKTGLVFFNSLNHSPVGAIISVRNEADVRRSRENLRRANTTLPTRESAEHKSDLIHYYGTGRRKSAIARVFLRPGSGNFTVNGKQFDEYFVTPAQRTAAKTPLGIADINETFDILSTVRGGSVNGQADAVKLGIARALMEFNIELRETLKAEGFVPRDARVKKRTKYSQKNIVGR